MTPEDTTVVLGNPDTVHVADLPVRGGSARPGRLGLRGCWRYRHVEPQAQRPPSDVRYDLLLSLVIVFVSATGLSVVRWAEDYHLFILGLLALIAASLGRIARRRRWARWVPVHVSGMGLSYILLLTALYVDNGKSLPLWKDLPPISYWLLPAAIGIPLIIRALLRHPLARQ